MLIVSRFVRVQSGSSLSCIHPFHPSIPSIHLSIYNIIVSLCCRNSIHIAVYLAIQ